MSEESAKQLIERQRVKAAIVQSVDPEAMKILIDDMLTKEKKLIEELILAQNETVMCRLQGEIKGIREFIKSYFSHMSIETTDQKKRLY